ncbi:hypothetical protein [Metapseudomonas otitidis]|uniref:Uncharacterized protein n=1 Tax=Metapseudomonas otitidis TaxID=319939 RepID=A0A679GIU1_9GAMM|nr:hypothetical protein [Pseudomonas otitidis]BCA26737.1 hypothetical protein PtoMrB4_07140 [Pseudomonas otitidis]
MNAPQILAGELFTQLKAAIDQAVEQESFAVATAAAEKSGMQGGRKDPSIMTLGFTYEYSDATGATVTLVVRSWDTSSPFQIKPDRNKMTVELVKNGKKVDSYTNSYED